MTQTATNPQTGETVVLIGGEWKPATQTATNRKGEKAYLVEGAWVTAGSPDGGVAAEGVKGLLRGAGQTASMIPQGISNLLPAPLGQVARQGFEFLSAPSRSWVQPSPQTNTERMVGTGAEIAGSAIAGPIGGARQAALNIGLPALGGVVGEQLGGEMGKTIGALTPASAQILAGPVRSAIARKVAPNIETFRQAGTTPSVAQATESNFLRGLENLIAKFPGGVGVMRNFADRQQAQMGQVARTGTSAEDAGRAIESGVKGFVGRTKAAWNQLDDQLAQKVPQGSAIKPSNTLQMLEEMTKPTVGAEKTSGVMSTPKLAEIRSAMSSDLAGTPPSRVVTLLGADGKPISNVPIGGTPGSETMPFHAIRELRSKVGSMLDDSLVSGIPGGELKRLYGALSKDLEAAATSAGAGNEFARQSNYYRARMTRLEDTLERVVGKTPEETFARFMPKDAEQANKVRATMRSLDPEQRQIVSEAVVNRLGRAIPSKQNEVGEVFSSESFLTNWNKLSAGAKAQLFDEQTAKNMDSLARASSNLREGSKNFANISGTAGAAAPYGLFAMAATGNVVPALFMVSGAYVGSKMLTNPRVVQWLATPVKSSDMAQHLTRLATIYNSTSDAGLKAELEKLVTQ